MAENPNGNRSKIRLDYPLLDLQRVIAPIASDVPPRICRASLKELCCFKVSRKKFTGDVVAKALV